MDFKKNRMEKVENKKAKNEIPPNEYLGRLKSFFQLVQELFQTRKEKETALFGLQTLTSFMEEIKETPSIPHLGKRKLSLDINYILPAALGIPHFLLPELSSPSKLIDFEQKYAKNIEDLQAITRLFFLLSTYNWLCSTPPKSGEFSQSLFELGKNRLKIKAITQKLLEQIANPPIQSRTLTYADGKISTTVNQELFQANQKNVRETLDQYRKLSIHNLFDQCLSLARNRNEILPSGNLIIDHKINLITNKPQLLKHKIDEQTFQEILSLRYRVITLLCADSSETQEIQKSREIIQQLSSGLRSIGVSTEYVESIEQLLNGKIDFYFEKDIPIWEERDRGGMYVGEKPNEVNRTPQQTEISKEIVEAKKRPIVISIDVSASMEGTIELALEIAEKFSKKAVGHSVQFIIFSYIAGVIYQGKPILIQKNSPITNLETLKKAFSAFPDEIEFIAGATSIGNAINFGQSIALGTAHKMSVYQEKKGIIAHHIILSDNMHNTTPDVAEREDSGDYSTEPGKANLAYQAAQNGCSTHNCIITGYQSIKNLQTLNDKQYLHEKIVSFMKDQEAMQAIQDHLKMFKDPQEKIILNCELYSNIQIIYQESSNNSTPLQSHLPRKLIVFYLLTCRKVFSDSYFASILDRYLKSNCQTALKFFCPSAPNIRFQIVYESLKTLNRIYENLKVVETISFEDIDLSQVDADPFEIHQISNTITKSQLSVHRKPVVAITHCGNDWSIESSQKEIDHTAQELLSQIQSYE